MEIHRAANSPADGHCIIHSVVLGMISTEGGEKYITMYEELIIAIINECIKNASLYLPFLGCSHEEFINDLQMYIDYLNYTDTNPASSYKFSMTADALGRK